MKILNDLNLNIEDDKKKLDINYMSNLIDKLSEISNNIRNKINLNLLNSLTLIQKVLLLLLLLYYIYITYFIYLFIFLRIQQNYNLLIAISHKI